MASRVAAALAPLGALGANAATALALYEAPAQLPLGPAFPTACIVERTVGDRRLGTHVLAGLELLLPLLLDVDALERAGGAAALAAAFPPARPREASSASSSGPAAWEAVPTAAFISDHTMAEAMAFAAGEPPDAAAGLCWAGLRRDASTLASLARPASPGHAALAAAQRVPLARAAEGPGAAIGSESEGFPLQYTREGPRPMAEAWRPHWRRACAEAAAALAAVEKRGACSSSSSSGGIGGESGSSASSVLAYAFARLGADAGAVAAGLHSAGVSWGTYQDAMTRRDLGAWHCNAHTNNFVLVAEEVGEEDGEGREESGNGVPQQQQLLAALDLDMAFDAAGFVDLSRRLASVGEVTSDGAGGMAEPERAFHSSSVGAPPAAFERLLHFEACNLMEVLAGADASTGVPAVAMAAVEAGLPPLLRAARSALYDTMVLAYLREYNAGRRRLRQLPGEQLQRAAEAEGAATPAAAAAEALEDEAAAEEAQFPPSAVPPFDRLLHRAAHAVLRLAIIVMADFAA